MPRKTLAEYQVEQRQAESLLSGVIDISQPATPAPKRIPLAALRSTGQLRQFRKIAPGVLKYMGSRLQANLRVTPREGVYELWDMSQNGGTFVTRSSSLDEIERVLQQEYGTNLDSERVELEGLRVANRKQAQGKFQMGDTVEIELIEGPEWVEVIEVHPGEPKRYEIQTYEGLTSTIDEGAILRKAVRRQAQGEFQPGD